MICNCGKPTRDDAYVCGDCLDYLAQMLGDLPWIVEQLDITLSGQRGVAYDAMGGSPGRETPLAVHQGAYEARVALRATLVTWIRFCDEEHVRNQSPIDGLPDNDLIAFSRWLLWRVDGLGLNDLGSDAVSEITRAIGRCRYVIDRPAERRYAGPCECGRDLYAKPAAKTTKCPACEREYDVNELVEWMRGGVLGRLVTAREATILLGRFGLPTAQKTIDSWHDRKRLTNRGKSVDGKLVYLIDDVIGLAAQTRGA